MVTIYDNILSKKPYHITLSNALNRIKVGKSKVLCEKIRNEKDKEKANELKKKLPCVIFSGRFSARGDNNLVTHSGYVILDFDKVEVKSKIEELKKNKYIYSCWISPSGNGVKALVRIKNTEKHRQHIKALFELFTDADRSNINEERICFESFDENIYINEKSEVFDRLYEEKKQEIKQNSSVIEKINTWLKNRGDSFVEGERNYYIFKLASACCRFGCSEDECINYCNQYSSNNFTSNEISRTIKSAYNKNIFGSAEFKESILVDKKNKVEITINTDLYNLEIKPQEVIYGSDVKKDALKLYDEGYENVESTGISDLDEYFKFKKGEITLLSGYGNYGKSAYMKFLMLIQVLKYNKKLCIYSPEEYPAHEFYHDFVEMIAGCSCLPNNSERPKKETYEEIYDKISKSIFFVYPTKSSSTPEYIKQVFLELIIKEKVDFCIIDPFNQLDNDYNSASNVSKYLERILGEMSRFAIQNQIYMLIIAHPKTPHGKIEGNYPCPDVFDLNDGSMWNNKMDNIIIFHKPYMQTDPDNPVCEHHSKKIRRQKIIGKKGSVSFEYLRKKRRFVFNGIDYIDLIINSEQKTISYYETKNDYEFPIEPPF